MTRDDIIELALQCGIWIPIARGPERALTIHKLCRLATLVAAAERDALRAAVRHEADCVEACKSEIERLRAENAGLVDDMNLLRDNNTALRARIEEMEKQEPVAWMHETRRDSDVVTDAVKHVWGKVAVGSMAAYSIPLYARPGAKGEEK